MESVPKGFANAVDGSLNPYCNGRYSWRAQALWDCARQPGVLILIVMEDTHGVYWVCCHSQWLHGVLILIVMEDTHGVEPGQVYLNQYKS